MKHKSNLVNCAFRLIFWWFIYQYLVTSQSSLPVSVTRNIIVSIKPQKLSILFVCRSLNFLNLVLEIR